MNILYVCMYVLPLGHVKCDTSYCALKIAFVAILTVRSHSTSVQVIDTSHCIQSLYTFDSEFIVTHSLITCGTWQLPDRLFVRGQAMVCHVLLHFRGNACDCTLMYA